MLLAGNFYFSYGQTTPGIAITWNGEIGCQIYDQEELHEGEKEPIFLEGIGTSICYKFCENNYIVYTLSNLPAGSIVNWNAVGGSIVASNTSNNHCAVIWGDNGMGQLSISIVTPTTTINKTLCIEKIISPTAYFEVNSEGVEEGETIYACSNQLLYFTNNSNTNGGTTLVSYLWSFGDGTTSTAQNPTHLFTDDQEYNVTLVVTNSCNCTSEYTILVYTKGKGFDVSCPSVVCENQSQTYSLPFDGMEICKDAFIWSVEGGEIIGEAGGNVLVLWNQVDEFGFGYVTFDPKGCELECIEPSTIKIPVIQSNGTIQGPSTICLNNQIRYTMPQWPTTDFQWEIIGNNNNNLAQVILTDQRNEVIIQPNQTGQITLRVVYQNTLLDCGGMSEKIINVTNAVDIIGEENICQNSTNDYMLSSNNSLVNWVLMDSNDIVVNSLSNSTYYSYNFTQTGNYTLSINGPDICDGIQKSITVHTLPQTPDLNNVIGETEVCPNAPYTFQIQTPDAGLNYVWSIQNGTFLGSNIGNAVNVQFNGTGVPSLEVYSQSLNPIICQSTPITLNCNYIQIDAEISANDNTVCANSISNYQLNTTTSLPILYNDADTYSWSLSNPSLGSISGGQGTPSIGITWNNVSQQTTVVLTAVITKCTITETLTKTIIVTPVPEIKITVDTSICSGDEITLIVEPVDPSISLAPGTQVVWNFGSQTVQGGTTINHTFSNTSNTNVGWLVNAQITNPNGCNGSTNIASTTISVFPGPKAIASLQNLNGNTFCEQSQISNTIDASISSNVTQIKWFKRLNGVVTQFTTSSNLQTSFLVTPTTGFGQYYFIAKETGNNCSTKSNEVGIYQNCPSTSNCTFNPTPIITNTSTNNCGIVTLSGTATPTPISESWNIYGPVEYLNYTQSSFVAVAGQYTIHHNAVYPCVEGNTGTTGTPLTLIVPYVADFVYTAQCNNNNSFEISLIDTSEYFNQVDNLTFLFEYQLQGTTTWLAATTATTIASMPAGNHTIRITIQGTLNGNLLDACIKEIPVTLQAVPTNLEITYTPTPDIPCHDTPVKFGINSVFPIATDSYLWTFDSGSENTMQEPYRVFNSSGPQTVSLTITNKYGCSRTLNDIIINIPNPCFAGDIQAVNNNTTACYGGSIVLNYVPSNANECTVANYYWMNGNNLAPNATNSPYLTVTENGVYWLKIESTDGCTYESPSRITPLFITPPSLKIVGETAYCTNDVVSLTAITNATSLQWFVDGIEQTTLLNNQDPSFLYLGVGSHAIEAVGSINNCSTSASQTITISQTPTNVNISAQLISCEPYSYQLTATATGNPIFTWSNGYVGNTLTITNGGPYAVTASVGGCKTVAQIDVPKSPQDYMWIFPSGCYTDCDKDNIYILGPREEMPYWSYNLNNDVQLDGNYTFPDPFSLSESGSYTMVLNTNDQCPLTSEPLHYKNEQCNACRINEIVIKKLHQNEETPYCSYILEMSFVSNFIDTYQATVTSTSDVIFDPSAITITSGTNSLILSIIPLSGFVPGPIDITIQGLIFNPETGEQELCTFTFTLDDLPNCIQTGGKHSKTGKNIEEKLVNNNSKLIIYPNPAKESVTLNYNLATPNAEVEIYDLSGRSVSKNELSSSTGELQINTSSYQAGIYIVVVKDQDSILLQQKLIIE
jgi:hypothetical protein